MLHTCTFCGSAPSCSAGGKGSSWRNSRPTLTSFRRSSALRYPASMPCGRLPSCCSTFRARGSPGSSNGAAIGGSAISSEQLCERARPPSRRRLQQKQDRSAGDGGPVQPPVLRKIVDDEREIEWQHDEVVELPRPEQR